MSDYYAPPAPKLSIWRIAAGVFLGLLAFALFSAAVAFLAALLLFGGTDAGAILDDADRLPGGPAADEPTPTVSVSLAPRPDGSRNTSPYPEGDVTAPDEGGDCPEGQRYDASEGDFCSPIR